MKKIIDLVKKSRDFDYVSILEKIMILISILTVVTPLVNSAYIKF